MTAPANPAAAAAADLLTAIPPDGLACQDWMPSTGTLTLLIHAGRRDAAVTALAALDGWRATHRTSDRHEAAWHGVLHGVSVRIHLMAEPTRIWKEAAA